MRSRTLAFSNTTKYHFCVHTLPNFCMPSGMPSGADLEATWGYIWEVPAWASPCSGGGFCLGESLTEQTPLLHPYLGKEACQALPPHEHSPNTARTHSEHKSRRKGRKRLKHSRAGNYRKLKSWKHSRAGNSSAGPGYVFCRATVSQSEALERRKLKRQARLRFLPCDSYTI